MITTQAELDAVEAIPGSMSAHAVTTSNGTARLVKPRPTPNLPNEPYRTIDSRDMQACNENALAALMVHDIRRVTAESGKGKAITVLTHDGHKWAARSIDYWLQLFKLKSVNKVRTAIRDMQNSGLVVRGEYFFNGNMTPHYRMAWGVEINTPHVEFNTPPVEINTPIKHSYTKVETKVEGVTSASQKTLATGTPLNASKGEQGEAKSTPVPMQPKPSNPVPVGEPKPLPEKYLAWAVDWENLTGKPMDLVSAGKIKQMGVSLWEWGIDLRELMAYTLPQWSKFTLHAVSVKGLNVWPEEPSLDFFKRHLDAAAQLLAAEKKKDAVWRKQAAHAAQFIAEQEAKKAQQPEPPKEEPVSIEEVQQALDMLAAKKANPPTSTADKTPVSTATIEGSHPQPEPAGEAVIKPGAKVLYWEDYAPPEPVNDPELIRREMAARRAEHEAQIAADKKRLSKFVASKT